MNRIINDPFKERYHKLDNNRKTTLICITIIKSFINDNYKLKNKNNIIIHGKGTGALKKATHEYLKGHKMVEKYYIDGLNDGQTIVELKI